jgi:predicted O-methyltransferase YrrM
MMRMALFYVLSMIMLIAPLALAQEEQFTDREKQLPVYKLLIKLHRIGLEEGMTNVPPQDGRLLQMLVKMSRAKSVLEIGTSSGVSTIWMALGLKETGGKITTLEIDQLRANIARENFRQAGLEDRIKLIEGDALKIMPTLTGTYDMVFIDAAKEQYKQYLELIYSRIPKGGVIIAHNAVRMAHQIRDYLDFVQNNPGLDTVILTTGNDGVALSYKK